MKNIFIILMAFLFLQPVAGQVKSGKVVYKVANKMDKKEAFKELEKNNATSNFGKRFYQNMNRVLPYLSYHLRFNTKQSLFNRPPSLTNDNGQNLDYISKLVTFGGDYYYTDIQHKIILHKINLNGVRLVKSDRVVNWKITKEKKKIKGYLCEKATALVPTIDGKGEINVVAWFCPDIPFQFGPLNFSGLPGLILGLKINESYYYYADQIKLSSKEETIEKPKKGKIISQAEFQKLLKKRAEKNPYISN